jgi:O-methyltransferase
MSLGKKLFHKSKKLIDGLISIPKISQLEKRIAYLENRLLDYYRDRWDAISKLTNYLIGAQLEGDYCEFGVAKGKTFSYAVKTMSPLPAFKKMRFLAFDSFEGLPELCGIDKTDGYSSGYAEGDFAFSEEEFIAYLEETDVALDRVKTIKGWFNKTLVPETAELHNIKAIQAAWIDCDLYESTVPILEFLTDKLVVGSVILFDDWHCFRNLPDFGEQRACAEWLAMNPDLELRPLFSFGYHGEAFTVGKI